MSEAYWVTPSGKVISVYGTHIQYIADNPGKFRTTTAKIKAEFAKYKEFYPKSEGKAREKIMIDAVKKGWIRIRLENRSATWKLETWRWGNREKNAAWNWAYKITNGGKSHRGSVIFIADSSNKIVGQSTTSLILSFKGDMFESIKKQRLIEASLSRIWRDYQENEFSIITAWRQDIKGKENKSNLDKLKSAIQSAGYGYVRIDGMGQEEIDGKIVSVKEPALLVKNVKAGGEALSDTKTFEKFMIRLGKKYDQWGIVLHNPIKGTRLVTLPDGNVDSKFSKFSPTKVAKFFSKLKGKTFVFEGFKYSEYQGFLHGMSLEKRGAIDILRGENEEKWLKEILEIAKKIKE